MSRNQYSESMHRSPEIRCIITPSRGAGFELRFKPAPREFETLASVSRFLESKFYESLINFRSHHNKTDHSYK